MDVEGGRFSLFEIENTELDGRRCIKDISGVLGGGRAIGRFWSSFSVFFMISAISLASKLGILSLQSFVQSNGSFFILLNTSPLMVLPDLRMTGSTNGSQRILHSIAVFNFSSIFLKSPVTPSNFPSPAFSDNIEFSSVSCAILADSELLFSSLSQRLATFLLASSSEFWSWQMVSSCSSYIFSLMLSTFFLTKDTKK